MTKRQGLKTLWLNLSSNVKLCRNCLNDRQEAKHNLGAPCASILGALWVSGIR